MKLTLSSAAPVLVALLLPVSALAPAAEAGEAARAALEESLRAYAGAAPFQETLELTLELPDGSTARRRQVYGVIADGGAFLTLSAEGSGGLTLLARDGRAVSVWDHIPGRYAEVPYDGDLAQVFQRLQAAQSNLSPPAPVVAAQGASFDGFLEALRFGILGPLTVGEAETVEGEGGDLFEVALVAANGQAHLGLDPQTHRFRTIRFAFGEGAQQVRGTGRFHFAAGPPGDAPAWPDLSGREAVASFPALEGGDYPLGDPAPEVDLRNPSGGSVRLADLGDHAVVLDFWATWCVPCWDGLEKTEELAAWAAASGLPVRVFAVDTLESVDGFDEQRELALGFLDSRGLDLPLLIDVGNRAFAALHNPGLPSLVIIGPDGRLAGYHSGVSDDMVDTVRGEVLALLD